MPEEQPIVSQLYIKLDNSEVAQEVMTNVAEVVVDQHSHLPDMFTIRLLDPELKMLDEGPFNLAKSIEIEAEHPDGSKLTLIKGEITALEPDFNEGMIAKLLVRGYDKSHRLYRETKSKAYLNVKDSDLANQIAGNAGLQAKVDTTPTVYDHVFQDNQTDLSFLMHRAWRIGYECFVADGKLTFRKPPANEDGVTLKWGEDLLSFHPRMTLAEQVDEVLVKGWDVDKQSVIVGQAQNGRLYPNIKESKDGAAWAKGFGAGKWVIVDQSVVSQAEADALAAARLNEVSGTFVEADGIVLRRPDVKAGRSVKLEGLGNRLSGSYLVTSATHVYSGAGFKTTFSVRGSRTGMLAEQLTHLEPRQRWFGVVTAVITNTDDPQNWGRVKLKFPWMTDDAESDWARVLGLGVGPDAGFCAIPDVGDEVLVAFEHGEFGRPFVLGGMWNGQHALPAPTVNAAAGEKPLVRTWQSRSGHWMAMHDDADNKIEIATQSGHHVLMDDANKKIEITTSGGLSITLDDNGQKVSLKSGGDVAIESSGNMKLTASGNLDLEASGQVNVKGSMVNIN